MTRFLLFILLLFLLYTVLHFLIRGVLVQRKRLNSGSELEELVQDPYCQTYIPRRTAIRKRVEGRNYYFCNKECLRKFLKEKESQKT
jgi:uncharacterized protein